MTCRLPGLFLALTLTGSLLAACATPPFEPRYQRPLAPVPAALPSGPAYGVSSIGASPTLEGEAARWRDVFQDEKMRALIQMALLHNRDLRVAVAQIEAARAQYRVQRSDLLPTLEAQGSASAGRSYTGAPTSPGGSPYADSHLYNAGVGVTAYEVDVFGRVRGLTRAAQEVYLATKEARRSTQITLVAEVAGDDLTLAADTASLAVAAQILASAQASFDLAQRRLAGGIASRLDVASARTVVEQARADIGRYTALVAQDRNALELVVGAPVPDSLLPTDPNDLGSRLAAVPTALGSGILLRRPDVVEAEHKLKSANADIGVARAAFFPQISLTASGGTTAVSLASLFAPGTGVWSFAPTITLPLFDGGKNRANLAYARAEARIAVAQYEKTIQTAFRETADALADRGTISGRLAAEQRLVDAAAESLSLAQALYARGSGGYLDVLIAQRTLYAAQQSLIATRLLRAANLVTLYKVLGGSLEDRNAGM